MPLDFDPFATSTTPFHETPSPFVTLDVAHVLNGLEPNPVCSINHLLDLRSSSHPHLQVIGFFLANQHALEKSSGSNDAEQVFYFNRLARYLSSRSLPLRTKSNSREQLNVALLAQSGPDFLITVLACLRLGLTVLLLAPQLPTLQISHLLSLTKSSHLILFEPLSFNFDDIRLSLPDLSIVCLPQGVAFFPEDSFPPDLQELARCMSYQEESSMPAVIFHSSGTTGLPKPINTLHRDFTQILPVISNDRESIFAFCTTPLYHGGFQDLFRALNSLSPICFFPLHLLPVTSENICRAVVSFSNSRDLSLSNVHKSVTENSLLPRINVFLTVPYILRLMKAHPNGLLLLQEMKYVCFGGASLEEEVGDELCRQGVKLVSRYGSSESGFLLSSYRDFNSDQEWNWLREPLTAIGERTRKFKHLSDRTYELIIHKGWPQMPFSADVYETGDLFESHSTKPRTWKYLGRADDIIVLSNGEKLNPNRAEEVLKEECKKTVRSTLMFGSGRTHCGMLVLLDQHANQLPKKTCEKLLERVNRELPTFAQIWPEMLLFLRFGVDSWPMSSKGLDQRKQILDLYSDQIEKLYSSMSSCGASSDESSSNDYQNITFDQLRIFIRNAVAQVLDDSGPVRMAQLADQQVIANENDHRNLFELGLNSLKAIRIKTILQKGLKIDGSLLPINFVYEHATISSLTEYLIMLRKNEGSPKGDSNTQREKNYAQMRELVTKFSCFQRLGQQCDVPVQESNTILHSGHTVLLTGATGSLGAHILKEILKDTQKDIRNIVCLIRSTDGRAPKERVLGSFEYRGIPTSILVENEGRLRFCHSDLSDESLGLSEEDLAFIMASDVLVVIHAAWKVNFLEPLSRFEGEDLRGLQNLLNLFGKSIGLKKSKKFDERAKFVFCSSLSSVSRKNELHEDEIEEIISHDPTKAIEIGYAQSKWVAEEMCDQFVKLGLENFGIDHSRVEVTVMRIGQLGGDLENGFWNPTEYWPLLISSCRFTGCLPSLNLHPSWLPVDVCAEAIVKYVLRPTLNTHVELKPENPPDRSSEAMRGDVAVYHVFNPDTTVSWNEIVSMIQEEVKEQQLHSFTSLGEIRLVESSEWLEKLSVSDSDANSNPSMKFLDIWKQQISSPVNSVFDQEDQINRPLIDYDEAKKKKLTFLNLNQNNLKKKSHENSNIQSRYAQIDLKVLKEKCQPISKDWISKMLLKMNHYHQHQQQTDQQTLFI